MTTTRKSRKAAAQPPTDADAMDALFAEADPEAELEAALRAQDAVSAEGDVAVRKRYTRNRPLPPEARGDRPLLAIVGRPNVGKSTLFNRLAQQRLAVVEDVPGVTRDRHYADADLLGRSIVVVDTGGFDPGSEDPMQESIAGQVRAAIAEADLVLCVLDASAEPLEADREAIRLLRGGKKPVIYVANKADSTKLANQALSLYELGIPSVLPIAALHGHGMAQLEDALFAALPAPTPHAPGAELSDIPRIAIIGRPNAGKSSLLNKLLGEARQIVDDRPGTTIDSIDALYEKDGHKLVFIDTAGIRRKRSVKESVETRAVLQAIRAIERSDVVVLMIDAEGGVAEQDAKIAGLAEDRGRALVICLNKTDLLDEDGRKKAEAQARDVLTFVPWAPVLRISAKSGRGVNKLIEAAASAAIEHRKRVSTAELNRFFEQVLERHPPPVHKGRSVRLYYVTQAQVSPPGFVCVTNEPDAVHFSYRRYVVNQIRERFGFEGTPVRVFYRGKSKKKRELSG